MFKIRIATKSDMNRIKELYYSIIDSMSEKIYKIRFPYSSIKLFEQSIDNGEVYIGEIRDKICACMILNHECNEGYNKVDWGLQAQSNEITVIHSLAVHPNFFAQGFAKLMVKFAINHSIKNNQKAIRIDILSKNLPALRLYRKLNFNFIATLKLFYPNNGLMDYDLYEYLLPPLVTMRPFTIEELSDAQKMINRSFASNYSYFPQSICYDENEPIGILSIRHYFNSDKSKTMALIAEGKIIGGVVLTVCEDSNSYVNLFYIDVDMQKKGLGYASWLAVEREFSQIKSWILETPICLIKNACFYVNKCGFSIVKIKDQKHDFRMFVFRKDIKEIEDEVNIY